MDDLLLIDWQTRSLAAAAKQADWEKVSQIDIEIAALLTTLQQMPLSDSKRKALVKLQQMHQQVLQLCQQSGQELQQKMAQIHLQRDGAQAYAVFADEETFVNE